jgi:hypothetical protein
MIKVTLAEVPQVERQFRKTIRKHFDDTQIDFPDDDHEFEAAVNSIDFEEGALHSVLWFMFLAGVNFGKYMERGSR